MLVPYVEFRLGESPPEIGCIDQVVIGPSPHPELALASARQKVQAVLGKSRLVEGSEVPYRVWEGAPNRGEVGPTPSSSFPCWYIGEPRDA